MALERQHFWGVTLNDKKREAQWSAENEDLDSEVDILNQLAVSQACLGSKATGTHVIEVTTKGINDDMITQPICVLQKGAIQQQLRLEFSSTTTFKLTEGDGPVHLAGSHIQVLSSAFSETDEDSEDAKAQKKSASPAAKQPPAKKPKMDLVDDDESDSEEEEITPVLVPIKDKRKKPVQEKSDSKKKDVQQKDQKPKKGKEGLLDKEAEEESDDDEDDDDFEMDSDEDSDNEGDDDDEEVDDDEDDDDSDDDDDDDDFEDSDEVPEYKPKSTPSKAVNGRVTRNTPDKKLATPDKKTINTRANTPKDKKPEATQKTPKSDGPPDIDSIKQKLLKSPNLPKKVDKFKNFMKTNMKITEDQTVTELWKWLQKNKK